MNQDNWLTLLKQVGAIAVIRTQSVDQGIAMAEAASAGGLNLLEVTWDSREAPTLVKELKSRLPHCIIGVGTLLSARHAQEAIASGAEFLFSPHLDFNIITLAHQAELPYTPGTLTPTEITTAWQAGASSIKVFPVESVGGPRYIAHLVNACGPLPLVPTGGVTLENAPQFLAAGAIAVGLGGQLFPPSLVALGDWGGITHRVGLLRHHLSSFLG